MSKITLEKGNIINFEGDAIICPSFADLTNTKESKVLKSIVEKAGKDLVKELTAIGSCEISNAVITKGYNLKVKNIVFLPYADTASAQVPIDFVTLHQALRNAFNLISLYELKRVALAPIPPLYRKLGFFNKLLATFGLGTKEESLQSHEVTDIAIGILDEYKGKVEELVIYN